jgi:hypothetical protein
MRLVFLVAGALALPLAALAQSLPGDQLKQALVGKTIAGTEDGDSYTERLEPDGSIAGVAKYSGHWQINDDQICLSYDEGSPVKEKWKCSKVRLDGRQIIWDDNSTATIADGPRSGP